MGFCIKACLILNDAKARREDFKNSYADLQHLSLKGRVRKSGRKRVKIQAWKDKLKEKAAMCARNKTLKKTIQ